MKKLFLLLCFIASAFGADYAERGTNFTGYPSITTISNQANAFIVVHDGGYAAGSRTKSISVTNLLGLLESAGGASAFSDLTGQLGDTQITDGAIDGGTGGEIADGSITSADLGTDSVSADELNATGVESELEAVLDLQDMQGAVTDAQVPDTMNSLTLTNATSPLLISLGSSQFELGSDPARVANAPVATLRASGVTNSAMILDLQPSAALPAHVTNTLGTGAAWIDIVDRNIKASGSGNWNVARAAIRTNGEAVFAATAGGTNTPGAIRLQGANFYIDQLTTGGAEVSTIMQGDSSTIWMFKNLRFSADNTYTIGEGGFKPTAVVVGSGGVKFGGTTASFPMLRNSGSNLELVQADGSGVGRLDLGYLIASGFIYGPIHRIDSNGGELTFGSSSDVILNRSAAGVLRIGTNIIVNLQATRTAAPTVASASTIAPTARISFVSGTAAIDTITAPSPISSTGGDIELIPTGLWTTTTSGNIALASTAVVNRVLKMTYDQATAKWYPSY